MSPASLISSANKIIILIIIHGHCSFSLFLNINDGNEVFETPHQIGNISSNGSSVVHGSLSSTSRFLGPCNSLLNCIPNLICVNKLCICPEDSQVPVPTPRTLWPSTPNTSKQRINILSCVAKAGAFCSNRIQNASEVQLRKYSETLKTYGKLAWNRISTATGLGTFGKLDNYKFSETDGCVTNSKCNGYICACNPGFFEDPLGFCSKKKSMFQKCKRSRECDDSELLMCHSVRKRCECPSRMVFDIRTMKCHLPVGAACGGEEFTGPIRLSLRGDNSDSEGCVPNAECTDKICECGMGYRRSLGGGCGVDYGLPCDDSLKICADVDLNCHSGLCDCKYKAHQYYDTDREECIGKVSAPCGPQGNNSIFLNCTENAVCVHQEGGISECQCEPNYAENLQGKCSKSFGGECERDEECDEVAQLVCTNGRCGCPDQLQRFDENLRKCRGLVGSRCNSNGTLVTTFRNHGVPVLCISNAICDEAVGGGIDGRCRCRFGYRVNENDRTCVPLRLLSSIPKIKTVKQK